MCSSYPEIRINRVRINEVPLYGVSIVSIGLYNVCMYTNIFSTPKGILISDIHCISIAAGQMPIWISGGLDLSSPHKQAG